jgi:hypothetical protein
MRSHRDLIEYIIKNGKDTESWYDLGKQFKIQPPDKERAKQDKKYKKKSIGTKAQDIWTAYLEKKNNLELTKEVYIDGSLKSETFTKTSTPIEPDIDYDKYEIEKFTTNPNGSGVPWYKFKKKEVMYDDSHLEDLKSILTKTITPFEYKSPETTSLKTLAIYGSDKHIGALTKDNSVYTNLYTKEEIKKRIIQYTIDEIELWISFFGAFDKLLIMELGDALDGFNAKTTSGLRGTSSHVLPQQMNNREQHDFYVEVHKELFDIIMSKQYAKTIYFLATSNSNHGGDFEYGAMRNLETYLNVKYPAIKTFVTHKPFDHFIFGNHCIIFGHGKDDEDMLRGLPLVLNDKVEKYITEYISHNNLDKYKITFVTGDLHQSAKTHGNNFRYKKVLSQYGSSKWMHSNFGAGQAGLTSEVFQDLGRIFESDYFFKINNLSNTGISFKE